MRTLVYDLLPRTRPWALGALFFLYRHYIYLLVIGEKTQISDYSPENNRKSFIVTFVLRTIDCMFSGMSRYVKDL